MKARYFSFLSSLLFSLNSFALTYVNIESGSGFKYQDDKNRLEVIFDKEGEVTAVKINDQMVKVEYSDVFEKNDHRFYSIDLNNDGHKDYAYNSSIGMKNKYFYYFIYNPITKKFTLSSVIPKLEEKEKEKFIGTEYDGIEKEERRFVIKDYELQEIKK
jgi:hypothetical protein